jgi:hypothetical protein
MVLLKQTIVIDIVPLTLNGNLTGKPVAEELPAPVNSLDLLPGVQQTRGGCLLYSAAIVCRVIRISRPL